MPKKDKKHRHSTHENERKLMEVASRKAEATRPTRDCFRGGKPIGSEGKILQPAGKALAV